MPFDLTLDRDRLGLHRRLAARGLAAVFALGRARGGGAGLVGGGFVAETCYLGYRALTATARRCRAVSIGACWRPGCWWRPILYLTVYHPRGAIGLVMLPLVLLLIVAAALFADRQPIAPQPASQLWGAIHGIFLCWAP